MSNVEGRRTKTRSHYGPVVDPEPSWRSAALTPTYRDRYGEDEERGDMSLVSGRYIFTFCLFDRNLRNYLHLLTWQDERHGARGKLRVRGADGGE